MSEEEEEENGHNGNGDGPSEEDKARAQKLVEAAEEKLKAEDYIGAHSDCDEAIRLDPTNAAAWNGRGAVKHGLGRYEEALLDLDEAIRLDPTHAIAWRNRGAVKNELGQYDEAIADHTEALRLDPGNTIAAKNLLFVLARQKTESSAEKVGEGLERIRSNHETHLKISEDHRKTAEKLNRWIITSFFIVLALILFLLWNFVIICILYECRNTPIDTSLKGWDLIAYRLPYVTTILLITFPVIWGIRLLIDARDKALILREFYHRLSIVEFSFRSDFRDSSSNKEEEKRLLEEFLKSWTAHGPPELLMQLRKGRKAGDQQTRWQELFRKDDPGKEK